MSSLQIAVSLLAMATFVGLSLALAERTFDLLWVALMGAAALAYAVFAKHLKIRAKAPPTRFAKPILVVALVFMACASFSFVYAGLGSPPALAWWNNLVMVLLELFFVLFLTVLLAGAARELTQWGQLTRERRVRGTVIVLGVAGACPAVVFDLVKRILQLAHLP